MNFYFRYLVILVNPIPMKTEKAIIYDDNCPLCHWYTDAFVKADLLSQQGRISFSDLAQTGLADQLDLHRSKHEIPLIDLQGGKTIYGLDSLIYLLNPRFPFIKRAMAISPINYFIRKLYKLISYNRGVMAPSPPRPRLYDCTPDFNRRYRLSFISIAGTLGLAMLFLSLPYSIFFSFILPVLGSLLLLGTRFKAQHYITYLGHLAVLAFLTGSICLIGWFIPPLFPLSGLLAIVVFGWQYARRFQILKLHHEN